ncbi:MAG: ABC transporter permease, partial [Synergistaceae bacterium]|nr:ABC transporter permease [Synergistaceae bacterium]
MNKELERRVPGPDWRAVAKSVNVYVVLFVVVAVLSLIKGELFGRGNFLNWSDNLVNLLRLSAPTIVIACGFTLIMIAGQMDLSVGSAMSLSSVVYCMLVLHGVPMLPAVFVTMIMGIGLGLVNGVMVMRLCITPVIATLITMNLYQGIARYLVPPGISAIKSGSVLKMPVWINDFARKGVFLGLPRAFFAALAVVVILAVIQRRTILGKYAAAIGGNRVAAELSGINTKRVVTILYMLTGMLASLAGVMRGSYMSLGDPLCGVGMETDCIIVVLLGGTAFTGGEGSCVKSVVGVFIIMSITVGLKAAIPEYWQSFVKSCVLIMAVTLNHILSTPSRAVRV